MFNNYSKYYFSESDIGQNRAAIATKKLSDLNSYVSVTCTSEFVDQPFFQRNKINVNILQKLKP